MSLFFQFILPSLLGFGGGLVAVFANWKVEKMRDRLKYRHELVASWRELLHNWEPGEDNDDPVINRREYASLRPHLKDEIRRLVEGRSRTIYVGSGPREELIDEIGRIEREWGLV